MTEHAGVAPVGPRAAAEGPVGRYRWIVVILLFTAMVINYVDRQMIGVLKPTISAEFGWSETDYADICSAFANSEDEARRMAASEFDRERTASPWLDPRLSTCSEAVSHTPLSEGMGPGLHWIAARRRKQ